MQSIIQKKIIFILLLLSICLKAQNSSYLDAIFDLENKISEDQFLDTILKIDFDKAMLNTKKYLTLTQKAEKIALKKNSLYLAKVYEAMSLAYYFSSKTELAITNTLKAGEIYQRLHQTENFANTFINLGWQLKTRDLNKAVYYFQKGIKILENDKPDSYILEKAYNNYGVLKQNQQELDSALYFHHKALQLSTQKKDSIAIPFAKTHIAEVYMKKQAFEKAEALFLEALKIREKRKDYYGITDSYLYLGDLFFKKKDYKNAIEYYIKGEKLATTNGYFPLKKYATEYLFKSYELENDVKNAFLYHKKFTVLKDSILNIESNTKVAALELEFNSLQKDKEIAEQQLSIKNRNIYAIIITTILLIFAIISYAIYKRNQLIRNQLQKEIELKDALATIATQNKLQEQRLSISRDLHDNIGSQLTFIISSLDNLKMISKQADEKLKDKIGNISSFTSQTIHELRDTIWAMNKNEISLEDLQARILSFIQKAKTAVPNINFSIQNNAVAKEVFSSIAGINIFRVVQEAINNAIKYADAKNIEINLDFNDQLFIASVIDDGKGFDLQTVTLGNGLSNMEKRMSEIGGKVMIDSKPNKGTIIKLSLKTKANNV